MRSLSKVFVPGLDSGDYLYADYFLRSRTNLADAAWAIAIGQSVGNPELTSAWETPEMFERHGCRVVGSYDDLKGLHKGHLRIAFPTANFNFSSDGVSQLMAHLMGGHLDINMIQWCHLQGAEFPESVRAQFAGPKFGISGIRSFTGRSDRPLLGGIIKPKTGLTVDLLVRIVGDLVDGGVDFIKEDEILSDLPSCPIKERVPAVMARLSGTRVIYATCVTADPDRLLDRVRLVHDLGGNAVHVNIWSGLGAYRAVRSLDLPLFLFFQKSGDQVTTSPDNNYYVSWKFVCELAALMGVDFIHAGMWGGYMHAGSDEDLKDVLGVLHRRGVMPSLSCGMQPGLVQAVNRRFGVDWMASCGGAIHGHRDGTRAGTAAMRQAIDGNHGDEYQWAVKEWGLKE